MPSPIWNGCVSLPKTPSSCCQITFSIGVAPRPPYSFGQCRQAQPPSAFFFCQALPTSTISSFSSRMRPSEDFDSSASYCFGALASIHLRAALRNSASCGVSSKFMADLFFFVGWVSRRRNPPVLSSFVAGNGGLRFANPPYDSCYALPLVGILLNGTS